MFVILALFLTCLAQAQPGMPSVKQYVRIDQVPALATIGTGTRMVAPDSTFRLGAESFLVEGKLQENSACRDGKTDWMRYGLSRYRQDTLIVSLFRTDRYNVAELEIKIWEGEFSTSYRVGTRAGGLAYVVVATDQVLVLEKANWQPGEQITGFINFRGTRWEQKMSSRPWQSGRDWVESSYVVRGPFKITIRK